MDVNIKYTYATFCVYPQKMIHHFKRNLILYKVKKYKNYYMINFSKLAAQMALPILLILDYNRLYFLLLILAWV